jgi:hypothetical protein
MTIASNTPLAEVTMIALRVLIQEMGAVNTARFLNQFSSGYGDYTQDKERLFGTMTVDDIAQAIRQQKKNPTS